MTRRAVFLDRDGTLIEERGYIDRLDLLVPFPWTADALRLLKRGGFVPVVVTNQSAIGRGIIGEAFLHEVHRELNARLAPAGAEIERFYFCPHLPPGLGGGDRRGCDCRKPLPGMIERACRELDLDPSRSVMVGDRWIDVRCGQAAGTRTVLVRTGHGAHEAQAAPADVRADAILNNLMEAAAWMLRSSWR